MRAGAAAAAHGPAVTDMYGQAPPQPLVVLERAMTSRAGELSKKTRQVVVKKEKGQALRNLSFEQLLRP